MKSAFWVTIALSASVVAPSTVVAQNTDFNAYVLKAVNALDTGYKSGGYDISKAFTHDIEYGTQSVRKTSDRPPPSPTMCVAAVAEIIMTAIDLYAKQSGDQSVFTEVPASLWQKGNALSLRANIFMFRGTGSRGTAHSLSRFGLGHELSFSALKAGDFINLNRTSGHGHAVVFMGYIDSVGRPVAQFGPAVKGFQYFSAQGRGRPDAGFAFRRAFFAGTCPAVVSGPPRDCNVIRSDNPVLLNAGRMAAPAAWRVQEALSKLRDATSRDILQASPGISRALLNAELERDLPADVDPSLDGVSDDGNGR